MYLNDDTLNALIRTLQPSPNIFFFEALWAGAYNSNEPSYQRQFNHIKKAKVDKRKTKIWCIPYCVDKHWIAMVIFEEVKKAIYVNSCGTFGNQNARALLKQIYKDNFKDLDDMTNRDSTEWDFLSLKVAEQNDTENCSVLAFAFFMTWFGGCMTKPLGWQLACQCLTCESPMSEDLPGIILINIRAIFPGIYSTIGHLLNSGERWMMQWTRLE